MTVMITAHLFIHSHTHPQFTFVIWSLNLADELRQLPVPTRAVRRAVPLHAGRKFEQC